MQTFAPDWRAQATRFARARLAVFVLLVAASAAGCAKIAEPQPPEVRIPAPAVDLAVRQVSDYVVLSVSKPARNTNGSEPVTLKNVNVYRLTETPEDGSGSLPQEQFMKRAVRILSIASTRFSEHLKDGLFVFQDRFPAEKSVMYAHTYCYAVLFVNSKNQTAGLSNRVSIMPIPIPPPPGDIKAEETQSAIRLKWAAPSENMDGSRPPRNTGYNIYRTQEPNRFPSTPINPDPVTATEFDDSDFRFDTTYYYAVTTVGNMQRPYPESLPSAPLSVTTKDVFPPAPPTDFSAILEGNVVVLLWSPSSSADVAGYRLFRGEKGRTDRQLIQSELIRSLSYRDSQIEPEKQYEYAIQAIDAYGNASQLAMTAAEPP